MLLIDTQADIKLAEALEAFKTHPDTTRCIYFSLMNKPATPGIKEKIIASAEQHIGSSDLKVYLCEDADICILAPTINSKNGKEFILDIASFVNMPANGEWVEFFELSLQLNKLLVVVDKKVEISRSYDEAKQKLIEQQKHERKRQMILNGGSKDTAEDIKTRRTTRNSPKFMIIEDDPFSCRLVENVLQKKYALTSLHEVNFALDTYTHIAPDLLFLDINLPDVTGHELLEKILILDPEAYVIMLSGNCDQTNIIQAMQKGAKGFVAKPFTKDKLFQYIDRCPTIKH